MYLFVEKSCVNIYMMICYVIIKIIYYFYLFNDRINIFLFFIALCDRIDSISLHVFVL